MPRLSRRHYRREVVAWSLLSAALGTVEGGVAGVLAKTAFEGAVAPTTLNLAVAILTGAPAFSNLMSFVWAAASHGRNKIRFLTTLQVASFLFVAEIALAQGGRSCMGVLVVGAVGARMCWSGVVTLRSTVWRANFPRHARATLAGKLATLQVLVMAGSTAAVGLAIGFEDGFRLVYPLAATIGLVGAGFYSTMRMRGHRALIAAEANDADSGASLVNPLKLRQIMLEDGRFRRYMTCMFVFGGGNIMVSAPLFIMLKDRFAFDALAAVAVMATIPMLLMPVSIPLWSRLLDRVHIIRFRAVHSWSFVLTNGAVAAAALLGVSWLLFLAAVLKGIAFGGGILAWNLGHHDFAPKEKASQYMGVHVTLTGVRGLLAPIIGVALYQWLEERWWPGAGAWTFVVCLLLSLIGAMWFVAMRRSLTGSGHDAEFEDGPPIQPPAAA